MSEDYVATIQDVKKIRHRKETVAGSEVYSLVVHLGDGATGIATFTTEGKLQVEADPHPHNYQYTPIKENTSNNVIWDTNSTAFAHLSFMAILAEGAGTVTVKDNNTETIMPVYFSAKKGETVSFNGYIILTDVGDKLTCDWNGATSAFVTILGHDHLE